VPQKPARAGRARVINLFYYNQKYSTALEGLAFYIVKIGVNVIRSVHLQQWLVLYAEQPTRWVRFRAVLVRWVLTRIYTSGLLPIDWRDEEKIRM
jgi:hypothetical protein